MWGSGGSYICKIKGDPEFIATSAKIRVDDTVIKTKDEIRVTFLLKVVEKIDKMKRKELDELIEQRDRIIEAIDSIKELFELTEIRFKKGDL